MLNRLLWQSPQYLPVALTAALAVAVVVIWLYRLQSRLLPPPWTWLVPAFRLAALGALLLSLLRPSIVRPRDAKEQGAIVLLVDRSRSMSVVDPHRGPGQRIALADALGLLPVGIRPPLWADLRSRAEALQTLVDAFTAAKSEVDYAQLSGRGAAAAASRLQSALATLRSAVEALSKDAAGRAKATHLVENCTALLAQLDPSNQAQQRWSRQLRQKTDEVIIAAADAQNAADGELYRNNSEARDAADQLISRTRMQLVQRALTDPTTGLLANLPPQTPVLAFGAEPGLPPLTLATGDAPDLAADGDRSDLSGAIAAVRQKLRGRSAAAVVLISDGRQVGGSNGAAPVLDIPLLTLGVGDAKRRDIAISRFDLPATVFVGETATARVELFSSGMKEKDQSVNVKVDGPGDPQTQHALLTEGRMSMSFPLKFTTPGVQRVTAAVTTIPSDKTTANNTSERLVKVLADRVAVAVIGGSVGWDFQYLRNALLRTPWVKCHDEIVRPGSATLKMTPQEILEEQVLILDDVAPEALSAEQWDAIGKLVTERGGGVIVIAGDDVTPQRLESNKTMAEFLPWRAGQPPAWRIWPGETPGFRPLPADAASDAVKLADDPSEDRKRWAELPAMFRILAINAAKPNVRPLLVDRDSGSAVLTESRVGVGRALFLGATETWRWRYKVGERDQDRFWLQLIREAGEAPYAVHDETMALDLDNVSVTPDEPVHVRARVLDSAGRPAIGVTPSVRVERGGVEIQNVPLRPAVPDADTGRFVATLPGLAAGSYDVRLVINGTASKLSVPLTVAPNFEAELADVSADDANLKRLAEASGGEFLRLDQVRSLPAKLAAAREHRPQSIEYPLWDSPYLFLFVLGCLGSEWAMRKRFGLV